MNFDHIKRHYYMTHEEINPTRIVPIGPALDLLASHGREKSLNFDRPAHRPPLELHLPKSPFPRYSKIMKKTLLLVVFVAAGWAIFAGAQNPPEKAAPSEMLLTVLEDLKGVEEGLKKSRDAKRGVS
ncbi:MAG: hypothetical protein WDN28_14540 [Chthoniobacter sp.]